MKLVSLVWISTQGPPGNTCLYSENVLFCNFALAAIFVN